MERPLSLCVVFLPGVALLTLCTGSVLAYVRILASHPRQPTSYVFKAKAGKGRVQWCTTITITTTITTIFRRCHPKITRISNMGVIFSIPISKGACTSGLMTGSFCRMAT